MKQLAQMVVGILVIGSISLGILTMVPSPSERLRATDTWQVPEMVWNCSTDSECIEECLKVCPTAEACRTCWDVFIDLELADRYQDRIDWLRQ